MKPGVYLALLAVMLFFADTAQTSGDPIPGDEQFFHANQAYKEGRFLDAVEGYELLLRAGFENGHLYYNMGNALFRLDRLGPAILNYERARLYIPRDADLNFNLNYARDRVQDQMPESEGLIHSAFFWLDALNLAEAILRKRLLASEDEVDAYEDKLVEAVTGLVVLGHLPPMEGVERNGWTQQVWTALASQDATRPTAIWLSAALSAPDRLSLLDRILQRLRSSQLPLLVRARTQSDAADPST